MAHPDGGLNDEAAIIEVVADLIAASETFTAPEERTPIAADRKLIVVEEPSGEITGIISSAETREETIMKNRRGALLYTLSGLFSHDADRARTLAEEKAIATREALEEALRESVRIGQ